MKVWYISDVHGKHNDLTIPSGIDGIFVGGDVSNFPDRGINANEVTDFMLWLESIPVAIKVMVAGNHDTSIESRLVRPQDFGVTYLEHDFTIIEGKKIFGSPYTPSFGVGWAFNKARHNLHDVWQSIPLDSDVIITHGPPRGILDLSYNRQNELELCGCSALAKRVKVIKPKYHLFGHIHNFEDIVNQGTREHGGVIYVNGSCVTDGEFRKPPSSNGVVIEI